MRTLPAALATAVQQESTSLCRLVRITRTDGVAIRLTDAVFGLIIGSEYFRADVGFSISSMMVGLNIQQMQGVTLQIAMVTGGITREDIRSRRYYGAKVDIYEADWTNPTNTQFLMFTGMVGRIVFTESGACEMEVLPPQQDANLADEQYSQTCRADLGDSRCTFPINAFKIPFKVQQVINTGAFQPDTFGPTAAATPLDNYFGFGQIQWLTGPNANWQMDILASDFAGKAITLFLAPPSPMLVGDTGIMYPGCNKQLSTCGTKFNNVLNFRGEPFAPQWTISGPLPIGTITQPFTGP